MRRAVSKRYSPQLALNLGGRDRPHDQISPQPGLNHRKSLGMYFMPRTVSVWSGSAVTLTTSALGIHTKLKHESFEALAPAGKTPPFLAQLLKNESPANGRQQWRVRHEFKQSTPSPRSVGRASHRPSGDRAKHRKKRMITSISSSALPTTWRVASPPGSMFAT